jgi:lycopene beta-cyclase
VPTPIYDFVFAGGGLSALSLADRLASTPGLQDRSLLIVDPDDPTREHRTWCFWAEAPTRYDALAYRRWGRLRLVNGAGTHTLDLAPYHYQMIRALDFYADVRGRLAARPNITFRADRVTRLEDNAQGTQAHLESGGLAVGRWVFDSRFRPVDARRALEPVRAAETRAWAGLPQLAAALEAARYHCLCQHFVGWLVQTERPAFDPAAATFFDFRTDHQREWRFFYVLPLDADRALVEYVTLSAADAEQALAHYLGRVLNVGPYQVLARERGANPLTDRPFPRRTGQRTLTLGTAGGRVKPSSGYAFTRIQRDAEAITRSLARHGHPFDLPADAGFYRLCDSLMLDVIQRQGHLAAPLFSRLFARNPPARVLRFLDERTSPLDNLRLMATMPPGLMLRALGRWARYSITG